MEKVPNLGASARFAHRYLFYNLFPDGKGDPMSLHTGCAVEEGTKWAATLWTWNTAKQDDRDVRHRVRLDREEI